MFVHGTERRRNITWSSQSDCNKTLSCYQPCQVVERPSIHHSVKEFYSKGKLLRVTLYKISKRFWIKYIMQKCVNVLSNLTLQISTLFLHFLVVSAFLYFSENMQCGLQGICIGSENWNMYVKHLFWNMFTAAEMPVWDQSISSVGGAWWQSAYLIIVKLYFFSAGLWLFLQCMFPDTLQTSDRFYYIL